jgi:ABC-type polysaccharide/polyol phosphate transport system ATPase subunit
MNDEFAIKVQNLSKVYKLYDSPSDRFKEAFHPFRKQYHHDFYALHNINFNLKKGDTLGIIGKNGSGKSTLLKILTSVLTPTVGSVEVNGKVSALLELGTGFNPEFTGIENVYLSGTIMGYRRDEMDAKLDDILAFADIGEFVHQPVKMYSSGMYVRLAFAVAINVDPDILIVDEALAVGDMTFQKKCMEKIDNFQDVGKTIVFCSHDMHTVSSLCQKALWIHDGKIADSGDGKNVISSYVSWMTNSSKSSMPQFLVASEKNPNYYIRNSEEVEIVSVKLFDDKGISRDVFFNGEDLVFEITYNSLRGIKDPNYSVIIFRNDGVPVAIGKASYVKGLKPAGLINGTTTIKAVLKNIQLNQGLYTFGFSVWDKVNKISYANNIVKEFEIKSLKIVFGPTEEKCVYIPEIDWIF